MHTSVASQVARWENTLLFFYVKPFEATCVHDTFFCLPSSIPPPQKNNEKTRGKKPSRLDIFPTRHAGPGVPAPQPLPVRPLLQPLAAEDTLPQAGRRGIPHRAGAVEDAEGAAREVRGNGEGPVRR